MKDAADNDAGYAALIEVLGSLRAEMLSAIADSTELPQVHPAFQESARNLLHYLTLRRHDVRELQTTLTALGLSSLGRSEGHVLSAVESVLSVLQRLHQRIPARDVRPATLDYARGRQLLAEHTSALLGPAPAQRDVAIMVTMPSEAAGDYALIEALLNAGMNCMRINCAHDDAVAWAQMVGNLRRAERASGRECRLLMDVAGPKLRTGPVDPSLAVARVRPRRDRWGRVLAPARVWLTPKRAPHPPPSEAGLVLTLPSSFLRRLRVGDTVRMRDARGARRRMTVAAIDDKGCWVELTRTAYFVPGGHLRHRGGKRRSARAVIESLPGATAALELVLGDVLALTREALPGVAAVRDSAGEVLTPARIGCTIPSVLDDVKIGDAIWFDDGRIGGVIENVTHDQSLIRITRVLRGGNRLRADQGINLPDSRLRVDALTTKDRADLAFIAAHADMVALSFANEPEDVAALQNELSRLGPRQPAIVLKIETRRGFEQLPALLLSAMRMPACGVMIARGDLAVECGFERMAEVQQEILWLCEAAHVPTIWATQVLETLAKTGVPSRAEITDAAMAHGAECVMLNKGPHIIEAVTTLDDILQRMQGHQTKKRAMLRELAVAHALER